MDLFLCTHLIYAFYGLKRTGELGIKDPHIALQENNGLGVLRKFQNLKLKNSHLKLLLSVGGWNAGSHNFSVVAADSQKRKTFLNSIIDFLQTYNFDGLDIDWEYPNERHNLENNDKENLIVWLKELKEGFKTYGFLLTAALKAVGYGAEKTYNITEMIKYLDFINIMSYALNGIWSTGVGMNAPFYAGLSDISDRAKQRNFDAIAKYWIAKGVPREKIIMGIPFYGRSFTLANPSNHSVGAPHTGAGIGGPYTKQSGILAYNELCQKFQEEKSLWHMEWESKQMVPYAYYDKQWITYDDNRSIALKVDYVSKKNLGGVMIWTVELDDFRGVCEGKRYPLLSIINEGLLRNDKRNIKNIGNILRINLREMLLIYVFSICVLKLILNY
ncbi:chitinase 8 isoform 1-T2 [Cochliomyia hominivorax]